MRGNSAHTSAGGGGHSGKRVSGTMRRSPLLLRATCGATGEEVGQGKRRGTSGEVVQRTRGVRTAMSENGMSGRLTHACHGQRVGLAVSSARNISGPRNSRTAKAP